LDEEWVEVITGAADEDEDMEWLVEVAVML